MPVLQAGEVLVQVHAVGVNPPDSVICAMAINSCPGVAARGPLSP